MCLAVAVKKGAAAEVKRDEMRAACSVHRDGMGFAYHTGGKLMIHKGYFKFDDFWADFEKQRAEYPDSPFLIHFRMATAGKIDKDNTHPFRFKGGVFVHNGIIGQLGDAWGTGQSDTAHLAKLMHDLPTRAVPYFLHDITGKISRSNKLAVLTNDGELMFANEHEGHWREGVWFSNLSYKSDFGKYDDSMLDYYER